MGRTCPYIELAPQNDEAFLFATFHLSEDTRPFLTPVGISFGLRHEWKDVRTIWARLARALRDSEFVKAFEEWRERNKTSSETGTGSDLEE